MSLCRSHAVVVFVATALVTCGTSGMGCQCALQRAAGLHPPRMHSVRTLNPKARLSVSILLDVYWEQADFNDANIILDDGLGDMDEVLHCLDCRSDLCMPQLSDHPIMCCMLLVFSSNTQPARLLPDQTHVLQEDRERAIQKKRQKWTVAGVQTHSPQYDMTILPPIIYVDM